MISEVEKRKFIGYSLPDEDIASEQTIRKTSNSISKTNTNDSYPRDSGFANGIQESSAKTGGGSALADFLEDMGYLGETIRDK